MSCSFDDLIPKRGGLCSYFIYFVTPRSSSLSYHKNPQTIHNIFAAYAAWCAACADVVFPVCRWLSRCRCRLCTSRGLSTHCLPSSSRSLGHVAGCGCPKTWPSHRQIAGTIWETANGVPLKYIAVYSTVPQWNSTWTDRNSLRGSLKVSLGSSLYFSATVVPAWQTVPLGLWTYQGNKWNNVVSWIYRRTQVPVGMTNVVGWWVLNGSVCVHTDYAERYDIKSPFAKARKSSHAPAGVTTFTWITMASEPNSWRGSQRLW